MGVDADKEPVLAVLRWRAVPDEDEPERASRLHLGCGLGGVLADILQGRLVVAQEGDAMSRDPSAPLPEPASSACHGRDLRANIRARLYWLKRRGRLADRDARGRIRVR